MIVLVYKVQNDLGLTFQSCLSEMNYLDHIGDRRSVYRVPTTRSKCEATFGGGAGDHQKRNNCIETVSLFKLRLNLFFLLQHF